MPDTSDIFFEIPPTMATFDVGIETRKLCENMDYLKSLSVEEFTFRKKWEEVDDYDVMEEHLERRRSAKARIWSPEDIMDEQKTIKEIENMNPTIQLIKDEA